MPILNPVTTVHTQRTHELKLGCRAPSSARYPPTLSCVTTLRSGSACAGAPSRPLKPDGAQAG